MANHSEKARAIFALMYDSKSKEYSFDGSFGAEKRMWDRFFRAADSDDYRTAANVLRTLEENNWHQMTDAMEEELSKPANERKGYFDRAEDWTPEWDREDLKKLAHKFGAKLPSERTTETIRTTSKLSRNANIAFPNSVGRATKQGNTGKAWAKALVNG